MYDKAQLATYCLEQSALNLPGSYQQNEDYIRWRVRIPCAFHLTSEVRLRRFDLPGGPLIQAADNNLVPIRVRTIDFASD